MVIRFLRYITMSGLVGYGSSEDEEDEIQPEKPSKVGDCYTLLYWKEMDTY